MPFGSLVPHSGNFLALVPFSCHFHENIDSRAEHTKILFQGHQVSLLDVQVDVKISSTDNGKRGNEAIILPTHSFSAANQMYTQTTYFNVDRLFCCQRQMWCKKCWDWREKGDSVYLCVQII